jgi:hypothetical protein
MKKVRRSYTPEIVMGAAASLTKATRPRSTTPTPPAERYEARAMVNEASQESGRGVEKKAKKVRITPMHREIMALIHLAIQHR